MLSVDRVRVTVRVRVRVTVRVRVRVGVRVRVRVMLGSSHMRGVVGSYQAHRERGIQDFPSHQGSGSTAHGRLTEPCAVVNVYVRVQIGSLLNSSSHLTLGRGPNGSILHNSD